MLGFERYCQIWSRWGRKVGGQSADGEGKNFLVTHLEMRWQIGSGTRWRLKVLDGTYEFRKRSYSLSGSLCRAASLKNCASAAWGFYYVSYMNLKVLKPFYFLRCHNHVLVFQVNESFAY
ncbi:hypothetical protein Hanom_Chr06g00517111 [Helianthus anomalus]